MSTLNKAINLALDAHKNQLDKAGQPYILHPLRLMLKMENNDLRIIAVLHDVVEDSSYTSADLKKFDFSPKILKALEALTKKPGELYEDFIKRVGKMP